MSKFVDGCADKIVEGSATCIPHPTKKGKLIVGWVVDAKPEYIGVSNIALNEIYKWWNLSRRFGTR
jgi:hypothetical protein